MAANQQVIARLIARLVEEQLPSGWYKSYFLVAGKPKSLATPYFSLLIGSLLNDTWVGDYPELLRSLRKLQRSIKGQRSATGTYNYWFRNSSRDKKNHIPDDWDDTALAYASIIDTEFSRDPFAYHQLKTSRTRKGGFFETWILPTPYPREWQDADLWVNLNICYWLIRENVLLTDLWEKCVSEVCTGDARSRYYIEPYSAWFFFTRAAQLVIQKKATQIAPSLLQATQDALKYVQKESLHTLRKPDLLYIERGWLLATLHLLKPSSEVVATKSLKASNDFLNNVLPEPVILGWQRPGLVVHDASPALTLTLLLTTLLPKPQQALQHTLALSKLPKTLTPVLQYLLKSDFTQEIIQLPWEIEQLTTQAIPKPVKEKQALANLVGWAYYWLDDQEIDRHTLPFSIEIHKETVFALYEDLHKDIHAPGTHFWKYWENTMQAYTRAANQERQFHFSTETHPSSLPKNWDQFYLKKAGPYLLALESCYEKGVPKKIHAIYKAYLLAKQYSDDARDCLEDLHAERRTFCTQKILEILSKSLHEYSDRELEDIFLEHVAASVTKKIYTQLQAIQRLCRGLTLPKGLRERINSLWAHTVRHERHQREVKVIQTATRSMGNS